MMPHELEAANPMVEMAPNPMAIFSTLMEFPTIQVPNKIQNATKSSWYLNPYVYEISLG